MCRHVSRRNPILCIVPPYVLDEIARKGTPKQRAAALQTKSVDNTFRSLRLANFAARSASALLHAQTPPGGPLKFRTVYSAGNGQQLPGTAVRTEGMNPTGDAAVDEAYDGLGATFDFFARVLDRNSIDDSGMALNATVHFGRDYNNAFWNSLQMVFGDGDNETFNRFTIALDVIGHELSHGVTEDESQLQYFNQSGALNESMSDVFGAMIKQYAKRETAAEASWLIGEGLFTRNVRGVALRSMKAPGSAFDDPVLGKDPQPMHMDQFVTTIEDNGGVHVNSGIPNHAFFHAATAIGGYAWEKAGRIWYDALRDSRVRPNTGFMRFARITYDIASHRFGASSLECQAVSAGWAKVGIKVGINAGAVSD